MKMWSMKVIILLLFCYGCLSTGNKRVRFVSKNFYNVLHWDPVRPAVPGQKVLYSVQWKDAEERRFQIKQGCQNITALTCDLTAETPSGYDVHYWARVLVNGRVYNRTTRFKPMADTTLGRPTLHTYTTVSSLHVNVSLPLGPNDVSVADIITDSQNGPSKNVIVYILKITHPKWAEQVNESKSGQFVINLKNNQTEYCGYVVYKPFSTWGRPESENTSFCAKLQDDPMRHLPWLLISAISLGAIVIVSTGCVCNYVKGGKDNKSMPEQLVTSFSSPHRDQQSLDNNLIISKPVICSQSDRTFYATILAKPNVVPVGVGGYSPQDIPSQAGSSGSSAGTGERSRTSNPEDTSAQSSDIYSAVAVQDPNEERDFQQAAVTDRGNLTLSTIGESWNDGVTSLNLTSHGEPASNDPDPCDSGPTGSTLRLQTVRDTNEKLILSTLTFPFDSSAADTQRKPLLSDIIDSSREGPTLASLQSFDGSVWSDSGCDDSSLSSPTQPYCNSHYFPSQPVVPDLQQGCQSTAATDAVFESEYKENWIPEIMLERTGKDSCEYRKTNHPWTWTGPQNEEEDEEEEDGGGGGGEEGSREILLGGWVVQIQQ